MVTSGKSYTLMYLTGPTQASSTSFSTSVERQKKGLHGTLNFSKIEGSRETVFLCVVYLFIYLTTLLAVKNV